MFVVVSCNGLQVIENGLKLRPTIYRTYSQQETSTYPGHTYKKIQDIQLTDTCKTASVQIMKVPKKLQSWTKLLEKVFPIMSTLLCNKAISKTTPLWQENPFPQSNVASHKRPGIRLSFEYTTTLLSGEGGEGRTGTGTMFRKLLSKYTIFSTVLSKIVYRVIRVFSQEYLQGQNKNMLIKST